MTTPGPLRPGCAAGRQGLFLVVRFSGPTKSYIEQSWVLNDLELVD